jgi:hypothetical protein
MEKLVAGFLPVRRRLFRAQVNLQKSPTAVAKRFMVAPVRGLHQLRRIVIKKPAEAKDGDGSRGKTLARDPGTTAQTPERS